MKTLIEMTKAAYDQRGWDRTFDEIHDCAKRGVSGFKVLDVDDKATFLRDGPKGIFYSWTDAKNDPHRVYADPNVAFFRRGAKGEAFLHAQNF